MKNKTILGIIFMVLSNTQLFSQKKDKSCDCGDMYFPEEFSKVDTLLVYEYDSLEYEIVTDLWYMHFGHEGIPLEWRGALIYSFKRNNKLKEKFSKKTLPFHINL